MALGESRDNAAGGVGPISQFGCGRLEWGSGKTTAAVAHICRITKRRAVASTARFGDDLTIGGRAEALSSASGARFRRVAPGSCARGPDCLVLSRARGLQVLHAYRPTTSRYQHALPLRR